MTDKVVGIDLAAKRRERLKEVAQTLVEDTVFVKVNLLRHLAPVVGKDVLETLDRMGKAANYWLVGRADESSPSPAGEPVAARYYRQLAGTIQAVIAKLDEYLNAASLNDHDLLDLAIMLEIGAEQVRTYMVAVDIERQIKANKADNMED